MRDDLTYLMKACNVPPASEMNFIAADAFVRWAHRVISDIELVIVSNLVNSNNINWSECMVRLADAIPI